MFFSFLTSVVAYTLFICCSHELALVTGYSVSTRWGTSSTLPRSRSQHSSLFIPTFHNSVNKFNTNNPLFILSPTIHFSSVNSDEKNDDEEINNDNNVDNDDDESIGTLSKAPVEENTQDELMYALGVNLARQLGDITPLVDNGKELAQVAKGLLDTVIGRLSEVGQQDLLLRRGNDLNRMITERAQRIKDVLEKAGRDMLEDMAEADGSQTLESGVVIQIVEYGPNGPGKGLRPTKSSTVEIQYHGTLADGTVFDSTLKKNESVKFPLAAVIPGWRDGVLKMHQGETAMIGIPPEQGYGDKGTPDGRIPGGSTLFFKIQLIEVLSAGIGGEPTLLGVDGNQLRKNSNKSSFLLGADGKPL